MKKMKQKGEKKKKTEQIHARGMNQRGKLLLDCAVGRSCEKIWHRSVHPRTLLGLTRRGASLSVFVYKIWALECGGPLILFCERDENKSRAENSNMSETLRER